MVSLSGSPTTAVSFWDDIPHRGFGSKHEFETCLQDAWKAHERTHRGRLARYGRFGMTDLEARRRTPEPMREAYCKDLRELLAGESTPEAELYPEELEDLYRRRLVRYGRFGMKEEETRQPTPEHYREAYLKLLGEGLDISTPKSKMWQEEIQDQRRGRLARYAQFGMTEVEAKLATPDHYRQAYALYQTPLVSPTQRFPGFSRRFPPDHDGQSESTTSNVQTPIPTIEMDEPPSPENYTDARKLDSNLATKNKIATLISPPSSTERRLSRSPPKKNKDKVTSYKKVLLGSPAKKIQKRQNKQSSAFQRSKAGRIASSIHAMETRSRTAPRKSARRKGDLR